MKPAETHFFKIDLEKAVKVCGCCRHANRYGFGVSIADFQALQSAARETLNIEKGATLSTELVLKLSGFYAQIGRKKIFCRSQKCWVHFGDICSLWQPREKIVV